MTTTRRATLADFAPATAPRVDDARVAVAPLPERAASRTVEPRVDAPAAPAPGRKKYPHVSVYLPADTIKQLKLIAIEHETTVNDLCVEAIDRWMAANGHARSKRPKA